jgi:hypothetical protein
MGGEVIFVVTQIARDCIFATIHDDQTLWHNKHKQRIAKCVVSFVHIDNATQYQQVVIRDNATHLQ